MDGHLFVGLDFPQVNIDMQPMYLSDLVEAAEQFHISVPKQVADAVVFQYKAYSGLVSNAIRFRASSCFYIRFMLLSLRSVFVADSIDDTFYKRAVIDFYTDILFAVGTHMFAQYHANLTE